MANDLELAIRLELERRGYTQGLREASRETSRFAGVTRRSLQVIDRGLGRIANRWVGLATGVAGVQAVRGVAQLEARMTRLGTSANISAGQVQSLKQQIFDLAQDPDIRVDPSLIISAIEEIAERTGDMEFARDNIRNIALALQATGAAGEAIGGMFSEFQKTGVRSSDAILRTIDKLNKQGKEGAFTFRDFARSGPAITQAYAAMGRQGEQAFGEIGAMLQIIQQGVGSADEAATVFERLLDTFKDAEKLKLLKSGGIQVFDPEALKEGREVLRPITDLVTEITQKAGGRQTVLSQLFDVRALRAFNILSAEIQRTGNIQSIQKYMDVVADGSSILADSQRNAGTAAAAWTSLSTALGSFADRELTEPLTKFTAFIESLDKETLDRWMNWAKWAGIGVTALLAGRAVFGAGRDLFNVGKFILGRGRSGAGGVAGGLGGALGGMTPVPVWVVNSGAMGLGGGLPGLPGQAGRAARVFSKWKTAAALLGGTSLRNLPMYGAGAMGTAGLAVAGAGAAGYGVGTLIDKGLQQFEAGRSIRDAIGEGIAKVLATFGNDNAQAAIEAQRRYEEATEIHLKIDSDGNARVHRMRGNRRHKIDVDTGRMMPGVGE